MIRTDERLDRLPKEYFEQKLSNPAFPSTDRGTIWGIYIANFIFYIINIMQCVNGESKVMKYASMGVMAVAAILFIARFFWSRKAIAKHRVGFAHFLLIIFGEFRLVLLSTAAIATAWILSDDVYDEETAPIIAAVYIGAALLIIVDIALNLAFWEILKRRIAEGEFKEDGGGLFIKTDVKGCSAKLLLRVWSCVMLLSFAFLPFRNIIDSEWEGLWDFALCFVFVSILLVLFGVFAYADALLLGRAYYIKRFENEV